MLVPMVLAVRVVQVVRPETKEQMVTQETQETMVLQETQVLVVPAVMVVVLVATVFTKEMVEPAVLEVTLEDLLVHQGQASMASMVLLPADREELADHLVVELVVLDRVDFILKEMAPLEPVAVVAEEVVSPATQEIQVVLVQQELQEQLVLQERAQLQAMLV